MDIDFEGKKMLYSATVIALAVVVQQVVAGPECTKVPYVFFQQLKTHSKAQAFCTSKYSIPKPTCTAITTQIATM